MDRKPIGVGLVGLGRFGEFLLSAYGEMEEVTLVGAWDIEKERAEALASKHLIRVYEEFSDLIKDQEIEIVVISTPPFLHGPMAVQAARAGKHLLVEKPLAITLQEAQLAVQVAQENKVLLTVDYVLRHHPLHQLARRIVAGKFFGDLRFFSLVNFATNDGLDPHHWFWDVAKSGGILVEHGVHFFDLANQFAGQLPTLVQGLALRSPDGRVDRMSAVVVYGDKLWASFYHSFDRPRRIEKTTIFLGLTNGEIILDGWIPVKLTFHGLVRTEEVQALQDLVGGTLAIGGGQGAKVEVQGEVQAPDRQGEYKRAVQAVMRDLVRAIREKGKPAITPEDALSSLEVALTATAAAGLG